MRILRVHPLTPSTDTTRSKNMRLGRHLSAYELDSQAISEKPAVEGPSAKCCSPRVRLFDTVADELGAASRMQSPSRLELLLGYLQEEERILSDRSTSLDSTNARPIVQDFLSLVFAAYPLFTFNRITQRPRKVVVQNMLTRFFSHDPPGVGPGRTDRMLPSSASLSYFLVSRFWSRTFDPLYAFTVVPTFLNILIEYFREVTAPALRDNFDIVHKLLEETIDAGGHSLTTALNALRDIVLPSLPLLRYSVQLVD
ncbi:hypothetical protein EDB85DRAFT_2237144 [Lactarius pseudohatsudake]|nr:hypothetical protein EDB85DRAFT_2237144 [Lactarius pseudohatsudake]